MKPAILGSIGAVIFAGVLLWAFVVTTEPVSVARCGGILVVTALAAAAVALWIHGKEGRY